MEPEGNRTPRLEHPFSLLMIDIDNFKRLNDTFGHDMGDEAIRRIGKILREGTRGIDLAARIGGEEFAVLLVETELTRGLEVAERLRMAIRDLSIPPVESTNVRSEEQPSELQSRLHLVCRL